MDDVKVVQDAALANVLSAVESALMSAPAKRKPEAPQPSGPAAKRWKASGHMLGLDADLSGDSEEEQDFASDAAASLAGAAPTRATVTDAPGQTIKETPAVMETVTKTRQGGAWEASVPSDSSSLDSEQEALHSLVEPAQPPNGSCLVPEATPAAQATAPSQVPEVSALPPALTFLDIVGHVSRVPCQRRPGCLSCKALPPQAAGLAAHC